MGNNHTVREYQVKDWEMVSAWWGAHTKERALVSAMLPPVGIVVERDGAPEAACWVYLSAGIGVAFLESPVSKPGLSLSESSKAFSVALGAIEKICRAHDYGLLIAYTLPGIAKWLERRQGFVRGGDRIQLMKEVQ